MLAGLSGRGSFRVVAVVWYCVLLFNGVLLRGVRRIGRRNGLKMSVPRKVVPRTRTHTTDLTWVTGLQVSIQSPKSVSPRRWMTGGKAKTSDVERRDGGRETEGQRRSPREGGLAGVSFDGLSALAKRGSSVFLTATSIKAGVGSRMGLPPSPLAHPPRGVVAEH